MAGGLSKAWQILRSDGCFALASAVMRSSRRRQAQKEQSRPDARHIIVHAQTARDDQLDKMKEVGATPSFFSLHVYYWGDRHRDIFLGPDRAARISPARSAFQRGLRFTIHTDTPVVPMEPFRLMWAAVNRVTAGGARIDHEDITASRRS
jgi:predicted amidohydrolase YtcJ